MTDLGPIDKDERTAVDIFINNRGQVAGSDLDSSALFHGFFWQDGVMTDLGTLFGGQTRVFDINDKGQVVGFSSATLGPTKAFIWQKGVMTDLGSLGGNSFAKAINNHKQAVGYSQTSPGSAETHAVLWKIK